MLPIVVIYTPLSAQIALKTHNFQKRPFKTTTYLLDLSIPVNFLSIPSIFRSISDPVDNFHNIFLFTSCALRNSRLL